LPAAEAFVRDAHDALLDKDIWLFSASLVGDEGSAFPQRVAVRLRRGRSRSRRQSAALQAMIASISPREHRYFSGAIERDHWGTSGRAFFAAMHGRYGDLRDWAVIEAWANHIATELARQEPRTHPL
jgi:menaquinone-dependent protoporphyrinogen oxidase